MTREDLEAIQDKGYIYAEGGKIVCETIIDKEYPELDTGLLADLLADSLFDWNTAIDQYLSLKKGSI